MRSLFNCIHCLVKFKRKEDLAKHILKEHKIKDNSGAIMNDKQHDSSDEIRAAFEEKRYVGDFCEFIDGKYDFKPTSFVNTGSVKMLNDINRSFKMFSDGYKTATAKSQAEIEFLENALDAEVINRDNANRRVSELEQSAITMAEVYRGTLDKLKKQYKTEEHKCCGNCKRESDNHSEDSDNASH